MARKLSPALMEVVSKHLGDTEHDAADQGAPQGSQATDDDRLDRKSTRLNSSHSDRSRMPSSA